jgi:hypothetical protein
MQKAKVVTSTKIPLDNLHHLQTVFRPPCAEVIAIGGLVTDRDETCMDDMHLPSVVE